VTDNTICPLCGEEIKSKWSQSTEHLIPQSFFRNAKAHEKEIVGRKENYTCPSHIVCNQMRNDFSLVQAMKTLDALKTLIGVEKFISLVNTSQQQLKLRRELIAFRSIASMALKYRGVTLSLMMKKGERDCETL